MQNTIRNEDAPTYAVSAKQDDDLLIANAIRALQQRLHVRGDCVSCPEDVRNLIRLSLAGSKNEAFCVMFLRTDHSLIAQEQLFQGSIDCASVYPRVIAQRALTLNAAAMIIYHNHPSGRATPSHSDRELTKRIVEAMKLIDVRVLDHMVVGGDAEMDIQSFAELGYM